MIILAGILNILIPLVTLILVVVALLLILVVLMQRPKQEGLGATFGAGMTDQMFGAQTTSVLQKATVWLGITFFASTLLLAVLYNKNNTANAIDLGQAEVTAEEVVTDEPAADDAAPSLADQLTAAEQAAPAQNAAAKDAQDAAQGAADAVKDAVDDKAAE